MMPEAFTSLHTSSPVIKPASPKQPRRLVKNYSNVNIQYSNQNGHLKRGNSFVVGQKLRESKWFTHEEEKVFCAVVETGFVVESKGENDDDTQYGILLWAPGHGK